MAVEIEATGQLQEFLEILRKRKWQVLLPAAFILSVGTAFAVLVPKKYRVETQVELRATAVEDLEGQSSPLWSQVREAQNAALHIKAPNRVRRVIESRKWTDYLGLGPAEQAKLVRDVVRNIEVTVPRPRSEGGSTFVTIEYLDVDPKRAVDFLEHLREDWTKNEVQRGQRAIEDQRRALQARSADLEKQVREKQTELTDFQSAYGLSPTQPVPGREATRSEDPQYAAYLEMLAEEQRLLRRSAGLAAEIEALGRQLAETEPQIWRTTLSGGVEHTQRIAELEFQLSELERRRSYYQQGTKRQQFTRDIEQIQDRIERLREQERRAEERREPVENPAYRELADRRAQALLEHARAEASLRGLTKDLDLAREELRERNEVYAAVSRIHDELSRLREAQADVAVLEARNQRYMELLSGPAGNPFQITSPVAAPTAPSEPNPWLIVAFALVGGLGVGLGIAVLSEYSKSCFRSAADLSRVMVVPVLGVVNTIRTRAEVRRERAQRLAVGLSTGLLIGAVVFLTWAWASQPDLLAPWLREHIEGFRRLFV